MLTTCIALGALAAEPGLAAARAIGQSLEPEPAIRTSVQLLFRPAQSSNFLFDGEKSRAAGSVVAHGRVDFTQGWSAALAIPVGWDADGGGLANVRVGGSWTRGLSVPDAPVRTTLGVGLDLYLPTFWSPIGESDPGGSDVIDDGPPEGPLAPAQLHAYEPQLYFAGATSLRLRTHGTLQTEDLRLDGELAFTGSAGGGNESGWFNFMLEVSYVGWEVVAPFVGTQGSVRIAPPDRGLATILPRLDFGLAFAFQTVRLRVLGQIDFDAGPVVPPGLGDFDPTNPSTGDPDLDAMLASLLGDPGSSVQALFGLELGFVFPAL